LDDLVRELGPISGAVVRAHRLFVGKASRSLKRNGGPRGQMRSSGCPDAWSAGVKLDLAVDGRAVF